ncbi:hypothetical protein [Sphingomonas sp. IC4-52]|uniref:hypothetical protein n=1 Tax=Sphingomonas sp. IC4-52 TaxID=2887202 RepID=UPI001D124DDC|nr:hypothetical protein [Sphingomonas sp. IC4-52]MCC2981344.1 hypothetical protein [Sphingomonas sp. IC4-52]
MPRHWVTGWILGADERERLLERFTPRFPDVIAHHVTLRFGVEDGTPLPTETRGEIVGEIDDGAGVQALIVAIAGTTERGDGGTYHVTWSLDRKRGRRPVESNDVIARFGWQPLAELVPIRLQPARF